MTRPPLPTSRFAGLVLLGGLAGLLGGCSEAPELGLGDMAVAPTAPRVDYRGPRLSRDETAQLDRCVALMTPMLRGQPVHSTAAARGANGPARLEYVWINADMHDDDEDIARRQAAGARVGGHCQFDEDGGAVHVHAYALAPQVETGVTDADVDVEKIGALDAQGDSAGLAASAMPAIYRYVADPGHDAPFGDRARAAPPHAD